MQNAQLLGYTYVTISFFVHTGAIDCSLIIKFATTGTFWQQQHPTATPS